MIGAVGMWRTPAGDRVLTPGEWALVRAGLARAWDADWEMADRFLDLPPEEVRVLLDLHGIDSDYFKAVPDHLEGEAVDASRREMARLTGRTAPDGSGP
jgi:hypothetical protein